MDPISEVERILAGHYVPPVGAQEMSPDVAYNLAARLNLAPEDPLVASVQSLLADNTNQVVQYIQAANRPDPIVANLLNQVPENERSEVAAIVQSRLHTAEMQNLRNRLAREHEGWMREHKPEQAAKVQYRYEKEMRRLVQEVRQGQSHKQSRQHQPAQRQQSPRRYRSEDEAVSAIAKQGAAYLRSLKR